MSKSQTEIPDNEDETQIDPAEPGLKIRNVFIHGRNLAQKEKHLSKYTDDKSRKFLLEIRARYDLWKTANVKLEGPSLQKLELDRDIIRKRVKLMHDYKEFIDRQDLAKNFDSRSNLHSSVLEEFIYYLFRDLVGSFPGRPLIGKSQTFKDLFFFPAGYRDMVTMPHTRLERKDHDFIIGATINAKFSCDGEKNSETHALEVPAVAIECKTYLDKTMLEGSSVAAEQLKMRNPNALYIVVAEWLKLTNSVNLRKYKVDQIYILRKQKNTDREFRYSETYNKKPIDADVVYQLYEQVRSHLGGDWGGSVEEGLGRGWLI